MEPCTRGRLPPNVCRVEPFRLWRVVATAMTGTKPFEILLAEDNPGDVGLVREALKQHNVACVLHVVNDGDHAITFLETLEADPSASPLHLLLVDMHLPKRDGKDVVKRLRNMERYAHVPVVMITGGDSTVVEEAAAANRALSYFRKPSTLDEYMQLGAIVRRLLTTSKERNDAPDKNIPAR